MTPSALVFVLLMSSKDEWNTTILTTKRYETKAQCERMKEVLWKVLKSGAFKRHDIHMRCVVETPVEKEKE
jgi:hypothetical protein